MKGNYIRLLRFRSTPGRNCFSSIVIDSECFIIIYIYQCVSKSHRFIQLFDLHFRRLTEEVVAPGHDDDDKTPYSCTALTSTLLSYVRTRCCKILYIHIIFKCVNLNLSCSAACAFTVCLNARLNVYGSILIES